MIRSLLRRLPSRALRPLLAPAVAISGGMGISTLWAYTVSCENQTKGNGNKGIDQKNFTASFKELGVHDDAAINSLFQCFDTDTNGSVSLEEFVSGIDKIAKDNTSSTEKLEFVFNCCDIAGDGHIRRMELRNMVKALMTLRGGLSVEPEEFVAIDPISFRLAKQESAMKGSDVLHKIHEEFPSLKNLPMEDCISTLSDSISQQIINEASKKDQPSGLSFKEFDAWAKKGGKDATFLFSLFEGLAQDHKASLMHKLYPEFDNVMDLDGTFVL